MVMGKIIQTAPDDVDSSQFVLMRVIEYVILESSTYIKDVITKYYCFLKHEYGVFNNVKAKAA